MAKQDRSHYQRHPQKEQHGLSKTPEHNIWRKILSRCYCATDKHFKYYGARGIAVCNPWRHSFSAFFSDMGKRPLGLTIDRIDNDGNYEPGNCRWANRKIQSLNRRSSVMLTLNGKTQTMSEWASELGLNYKMLQHRYARGWSHERILSPRRIYWSRRITRKI